ncbi:MOSC domain-containing protein [Natrinema sp. 1APR25-10V2]|uniref:MOSC domain-containing protein n=1 Tax=Natrinema sp. 1APR25-10V2 TaxID=2951081 RepID=UPI0028758546|nr:MOSC domain-containing protein [Natrinema sp. 1APR25-10V2]MDS0475325.1 MOSC domain-containing protein [Natrinema sp. 1APR25-10V2]
MDTAGAVDAIHVAPEAGAEMRALEEARAVAGKGLEGDRYFDQAGSWSGEKGRDLPPEDRALTLFEAETLDVLERDAGIDLEPADHRRNVTTRNVAVDHLLDERFRIGDAVCEGVEICEPCAYLESLTEEGVLSALVHRGGLNVRIVSSGEIAVGDPITVL